MLGMKDETCKIVMSYETIDFRNIVVKFFFRNDSENVTDVKNENTDHVNEKISENVNFKKISQTHVDEKEISNLPPAFKRGRDRPRKLSLRYKNFETNISIFLQNDQLLMQHMQDSTSDSFVKSRKKEINGLFEKSCFEIISASDVSHGTRIFNSRFVNEIKNIETIDAYEKSRLIMQIYNDDDKAKMLTQTPTIQRMN